MTTNEIPREGTAQSMQHDELIMWNLVSDISQGLQISFTSIKAAISSLLGGDIFWDPATQHEFMQTIDKSVDDLSGLTAVMTVAMRIESQTLTINREPNSLQEILSQAKDLVQTKMPEATIQLALPMETRMAFVDFDYLRMALRLLLEVLISPDANSPNPIAIRVLEMDTKWEIIMQSDLFGPTNSLLNWLCCHAPKRALLPNNLRPETKLKTLVSYALLSLHSITMETSGEAKDDTTLILHVPFEMEA
jgi:hypothetical protein